MKTKTTKPRKILDKNYPLLSLKDLLNQIITENQDFPSDVLSAIVQARDSAWKNVKAEHENNTTPKKPESKTSNPT